MYKQLELLPPEKRAEVAALLDKLIEDTVTYLNASLSTQVTDIGTYAALYASKLRRIRHVPLPAPPLTDPESTGWLDRQREREHRRGELQQKQASTLKRLLKTLLDIDVDPTSNIYERGDFKYSLTSMDGKPALTIQRLYHNGWRAGQRYITAKNITDRATAERALLWIDQEFQAHIQRNANPTFNRPKR